MEKEVYAADFFQNVLLEIYAEAKKDESNYINPLAKLMEYILTESSSYDYVIEKYKAFSKEEIKYTIKQMILSNFLEFNYFRRKMAVSLDKDRLAILKAAEEVNEENPISMFKTDLGQTALIFNDALHYFALGEIIPIIPYDVVMAMKDDMNIRKRLFELYPLSLDEHMLTLEDSFTEEEYVLYTLMETVVLTAENELFKKGGEPQPTLASFEEMKGIIKQSRNRLTSEISSKYKAAIGLDKGVNYDKILLVELLISNIRYKKRFFVSLDEDEKTIDKLFAKVDKTIEGLSRFYDMYETIILDILINNWHWYLEREDEDFTLEDFKEVKEKSKDYLKDRFNLTLKNGNN